MKAIAPRVLSEKDKPRATPPVVRLSVAPPAPDFLSDKAREGWPLLAQELIDLGVLANLDTLALGRLCEVFADIHALRVDVAEEGYTYWNQTRDGRSLKANPAVALLFQAEQIFKGYLTEFGMTPSARTRVTVAGPDGKKKEDEFFD